MKTIAFISTKGGVGKTTAALTLGGELARADKDVVILDGDPNQPLVKWEKLTKKNFGVKSRGITVLGNINQDNILEILDKIKNEFDFAIIDLEGTANVLAGFAISRANVVIVPCQGSNLDANEAAKSFGFIKRQEKAYGFEIKKYVLFTRTSMAIKPKNLTFIKNSFLENGAGVFDVELLEKEAFRAVFSFGGVLADLTANDVGGLEAARINSLSFAQAILNIFKENQKGGANE